MEIKAELLKPYTEDERINFIVEYNHNQGYIIEETETALQALGYAEEEIAQQEQQRIAMLSLTGADVERGIYKAKGMDFDDIIVMVESINNQTPVEDEQLPKIDIKALKIELKANNFYRGSEYVSKVGALLGFTEKMLDDFFQYNNYKYLLPIEDDTIIEENVSDNNEV